MIEGSVRVAESVEKGTEESDTSSSSSSNALPRRPPLTQAPSIQSEYCFEDTRQRETAIAQKLLDLPLNENQYLIVKGILTKICRRRPKQRTFYLFNDALVYANISYGKLLAHPHAFRLEEVTVTDVADSGIYRNGFIIETPKKSFTVYASLAEEKRRWMNCISQNAEAAREAGGKEAKRKLLLLTKSPVWIPNSEATHCMVCLNTEFTIVQRRHHCRNCGKVVCGKCSQYRWVLPAQGPNKLRICRACHEQLKAEQTAALKVGADSSVTHGNDTDTSVQRLPVFAPPNWQQQIEETLNNGEGDSDSDETSDFDGRVSNLQFLSKL